ncbi:MAG: hypothetical protein Q9159_001178 [Coniocarpon cinnabarinum]
MPASPTLNGCPLTLSLLLSIPTLSFLRLLTSNAITPATSLFAALLQQIAPTTPLNTILTLSLIYQLRPLERLWSTRKLGAFITAALPFIAVIQAVNNRFTLNAMDGGGGYAATCLSFAMLVQWWETVPFEWRYDLGDTDAGEGSDWKVRPSSKWQTYVVAIQIASAQGLGSTVAAAGGWCVGWMWRRGVLPGRGVVDSIFGLAS